MDEALSSLMGPGPWLLSHDLQLPTECGKVHFTYKHKFANINVHHVLKIMFRVERGDDQAVDPKTGKRRLFDIVIQTPIQILSVWCFDYTLHLDLWPYSVIVMRSGLHFPDIPFSNLRTLIPPLCRRVPVTEARCLNFAYLIANIYLQGRAVILDHPPPNRDQVTPLHPKC